MGVTFVIYDPSRREQLEALIDAMEDEDAFEEVENSAYDRFAREARGNGWSERVLSEDESEPAEAFFEWFHEKVNHNLDKLYLTPEEAKQSLAGIDRLAKRKGMEALPKGFWTERETFTLEAASSYLSHFVEMAQSAVEKGGLLVIVYE